METKSLNDLVDYADDATGGFRPWVYKRCCRPNSWGLGDTFMLIHNQSTNRWYLECEACGSFIPLEDPSL